MRYVPVLAGLIAMVMLMTGSLQKGAQAARGILLAIGAIVVFAVLFALIVGGGLAR